MAARHCEVMYACVNQAMARKDLLLEDLPAWPGRAVDRTKCDSVFISEVEITRDPVELRSRCGLRCALFNVEV